MHRKTDNRYTYLIVGIGAIIVAFLIGYMLVQNHNTRERAAQVEFNKTHFNTSVKIYNVSVGKMTVNQAYKSVNKKGKNRATLKNDKIVTSKVGSEIISKSQIKRYFDKQYTKYPSNQQYVYENTKLNDAVDKLNQIKNRSVTYTVAGRSYDFKRSEYFKEVSYYDNKYHYAEPTALKEKIKSINDKVSTFHNKYDFKLPSGSTIKVKNESYGWAINTKYLIPAIEKAISEGKSKINGRDYIYGLGYSTYGTGYGMSNNGLGHTYIVVSIKQQKVWFYKNGKNVLTLNDVVTGTATSSDNNKSDNATPTGVWYIEYKESPSTLKGTNDDGTAYSSEVQYWMPFTLSGCGFHDASWRTDWSKTAYLKGGSHGCVNIKPSEIKKVWDVVEQYEPVIVYDE